MVLVVFSDTYDENGVLAFTVAVEDQVVAMHQAANV